jgi:hypothetical protein
MRSPRAKKGRSADPEQLPHRPDECCRRWHMDEAVETVVKLFAIEDSAVFSRHRSQILSGL